MKSYDYEFGVDGILDVDETTEITKEGRTKTYERINKKELRAAKMGRKTVICRRSIKDFLAQLPAFGGN